MSEIECVLDARSILGEGRALGRAGPALYWVDIKRREIHRFDPASGRDECWSTPEDVGSLAVREAGGLVVAMTSGFHFFDPASGSFEAIADPEPDRPENRFNDGKPDRRGRFWAGTMHDPETTASGALYRLDPDLRWQQDGRGRHGVERSRLEPGGRRHVLRLQQQPDGLGVRFRPGRRHDRQPARVHRHDAGSAARPTARRWTRRAATG